MNVPAAIPNYRSVGAVGTSVVGSSVGFTVLGIAKGSLAAFIQAKVGTFGLFSALQSIGATGGFALGGPYGIAAGAVLGAATYYFTSSNECKCDEPATEEDLAQLFALRAITSCIEPGTSKQAVCNGRGVCDYNKDDDELYCQCRPNFAGTYCEISKSESSSADVARCKDEFIQNCALCLINKFTLNKSKNCFQQCHWLNRQVKESSNNDLRPDVQSLETKRVLKLNVIEGTACSLRINSTCTTNFKYVYEHSEDHRDQLVVYYSSDEAVCEKIPSIFSNVCETIVGTFFRARDEF